VTSGSAVRPTLGRGIASVTAPADDAGAFVATPMSPPAPPAPSQPEGHAPLTREQKIQQLHEELVKLNAQLEYLRLMLRLRRPDEG